MMKRIVEGSLEQYGKLFSPFFFSMEGFLRTQTCTGRLDLGLYDEKKKALQAQVNLFTEGSKSFSPCKGSFGGFVISRDIKTADLISFIQETERKLKECGIRELSFRQFPDAYSPDRAAVLSYCLRFCGFNQEVVDLNYHLELSDTSIGLKESEPARIKAAKNAGFIFQKEGPDAVSGVYSLLKFSRASRGYPVTMDAAAFHEMFRSFPDHYQIFSLFHKGIRIAFAVTAIISDEIIYCFYIGEQPEYRKHSPVAYLLWMLAHEAKESGFSILDLGIGTDMGQPNFGLLDFKKNMGARASLKISWKKIF